MAKRLFFNTNWTPTASADSTFLAGSTYMALNGGTATARLDVLEVLISGLAGASAVNAMCLGRSSTVGTSTSALISPSSDGPMDTATAALASPPLSYVSCSAGSYNPVRSSSTAVAKLNLAINAFGGIIRWNAAPTQQWAITGNTASNGETTLSAENVGTSGLIQSHIMYEPY